MQWLFYGMMIFGGMFAMAWYGAREPKQKRIYGLIAIAIWLVTLVLANTVAVSAQAGRDKTAALMSLDQIAEAQRLAREWKPKK